MSAADEPRRRVLVVDDEADIRELIEITLGRMGLDTIAAADLSQARGRPGPIRRSTCA